MRIRFIFTLCSDRVPAISLVGSAGGIRTTGAAPGWGRGGIGGGGGRDAIGAVGTGGGGGGEVGGGGGGGGGQRLLVPGQRPLVRPSWPLGRHR